MQRLRTLRLVSQKYGLMQAFGREKAIADALLLHTLESSFQQMEIIMTPNASLTIPACGYLIEMKKAIFSHAMQMPDSS